jgi:hypothetical protein
MQDLPVLYKNKNDIATMIELYPAEAKWQKKKIKHT